MRRAMAPDSEIRAAWLLPSAHSELEKNKRIRFSERVLSIEDEQGSAPNWLVMPPLANGHDHGRGLRPIAYGAADAPVECWVPATYAMPPADPYLVAAAALGRMARCGIGHIVQCHLWRPPDVLLREALAVRKAAEDIGVRVAFVVPLRDRHRLGYGADDEVLACMQPDARQAVAERFLRAIPPVDEQLAVVDEIAAQGAGPLFSVQLGPIGIEWCSDALLEAVAARSLRDGRRVHMHLLESRYQREWADAAFPGGIVQHLADIGLLSSRLTVAHGVWLRPQECSLLAQHGVTVSVNTSSNLRLRSGVIGLPEVHASGTRFALGLDALGLDDDDDMLREMRLARLLHCATGFDEPLKPADFLAAATAHGSAVICPQEARGIAPDAPADFLALDLARMTAGLGEGLYDLLDVVHARATARDVARLVIAGQSVVEEGRVLGIDLPRIERELAAQLAAAAPGLVEGRAILRKYQEGLRRFYLEGRHKAGSRG
jgi:cytosine/adenosine deaminase-related metal-dependent hydrolase